jgi:hypothetical protein
MPDPSKPSRTPHDPVQAMIAITAGGHYCRIGYRRGGNSDVVTRVIEPRQLMDGPFGMRVRAMQIEPDEGVRTFSADLIAWVEPDTRTLPPEARRTNTFGQAGFPSFGSRQPPAPKRDPLVGSAPRPSAPEPVDAPVGPAWAQPWFAEYVGVVRECLLDLRIEQDEAAAVDATRQSLGLSDPQIRAAHAYLLGEELLGLAADGALSDTEEDYLTHFSICLGRLGWTVR